MSELKAKHVVDVYDDYAEHPCEELSQVYLKSEADKVITELKHQRDGAFGLTNSGLTLDDISQIARKHLDHQKHKRCLAMARIAQDDWHLHNSFYAMGHREFEKLKCEFYDKWYRRWLAIAVKFKPNKETKE